MNFVEKALSGTDGNGGLTPSSKRLLALASFIIAVVAGFTDRLEVMQTFLMAAAALSGLTTIDAFVSRRFYNGSSKEQQ
jgi:hypothetical protein